MPGRCWRGSIPTFAAADVGALAAQVATCRPQVSRLQAEADGRPFTYTGLDPNLALQAAIFAQRQSEYNYKLENYRQKINGLVVGIAQGQSDAAGYRSRLAWRPTSSRCARNWSG